MFRQVTWYKFCGRHLDYCFFWYVDILMDRKRARKGPVSKLARNGPVTGPYGPVNFYLCITFTAETCMVFRFCFHVTYQSIMLYQCEIHILPEERRHIQLTLIEWFPWVLLFEVHTRRWSRYSSRLQNILLLLFIDFHWLYWIARRSHNKFKNKEHLLIWGFIFGKSMYMSKGVCINVLML